MKCAKLDIISGIDLCQFIEIYMRGRVSYTEQRYSKANSNHMKSYDKDKLSKYIVSSISWQKQVAWVNNDSKPSTKSSNRLF